MVDFRQTGRAGVRRIGLGNFPDLTPASHVDLLMGRLRTTASTFKKIAAGSVFTVVSALITVMDAFQGRPIPPAKSSLQTNCYDRKLSDRRPRSSGLGVRKMEAEGADTPSAFPLHEVFVMKIRL